MGKKIGFLGDGQLARMGAMEVIKLGGKALFYGESPDGPCEGLGDFTVGKLIDKASILRFSQQCDLVILENEFVSAELLEELTAMGHHFLPSAECFSKIADKQTEKEAVAALGIPVTPFYELKTEADIPVVIEKWGVPFVMKAAKGGYDGYGNRVAYDLAEAIALFKAMKKNEQDRVVAEKMIDLDKELAVTVATALSGETVVFPVVETIQKDHICRLVVAMEEESSQSIQTKIQNYAQALMKGLNATGVLSFEFFVDKEGSVYFNESAPRAHNSAHYSMDGLSYSQFEAQARVALELPLSDVRLKYPYVVMVNRLGTQKGAPRVKLPQLQNAGKLHDYGKKESRPGRKMAH